MRRPRGVASTAHTAAFLIKPSSCPRTRALRTRCAGRRWRSFGTASRAPGPGTGGHPAHISTCMQPVAQGVLSRLQRRLVCSPASTLAPSFDHLHPRPLPLCAPTPQNPQNPRPPPAAAACCSTARSIWRKCGDGSCKATPTQQRRCATRRPRASSACGACRPRRCKM